MGLLSVSNKVIEVLIFLGADIDNNETLMANFSTNNLNESVGIKEEPSGDVCMLEMRN